MSERKERYGTCMITKRKEPAMNSVTKKLIPVQRTDEHHCQKHQWILDYKHKNTIEVVLLGDSLIRRWEDNPNVFEQYFDPKVTLNCGIGGDTIQNVLWRIINGELDGLNPKVWILLIGTNNLSENKDVEIVEGIFQIIEILKEYCPSAKIILNGLFPRNPDPVIGDTLARVQNINRGLKKRFTDGIFIEMESIFLQGNSQVSERIMPDGLHINEYGYSLWGKVLEEAICGNKLG